MTLLLNLSYVLGTALCVYLVCAGAIAMTGICVREFRARRTDARLRRGHYVIRPTDHR